MSRFTHESPMDFTFENGTGPLDSRSPFAQLNGNAQRFPNNGVNMTPRKRTSDSPSKSRTPGHFSPSKPLPSIPAYNALYNTPRKLKDDFDDSSAGETPRSPEPRDDSDATPEMKISRSAVVKLDLASAPTMSGAERERSSPSKQRPGQPRRESSIMNFITKTKNRLYSPGRGEIHKPEHAGAIEKATRRRKRDVDRRVARKRRHSMSDSGEDNESTKSTRSSKKEVEKQPHWAGSLFTFLAQHPTLPQTLSYYAQFLFNVFLLCGCGYVIYSFWSAVMGDIDKKAHEAMAEIMGDIATCAKKYAENNCEPVEKRTPFIEPYCMEWGRCKARDPYKVARAKVSAHTFAEIFNSFVEPISYKAMFFTAIMVFGCFAISNFAFGYFRRQHEPNYGYGGYNYGPPPPTPQRSFSNQDGFYAGTPWHQPPPGLGFEPQPTGGFGQIEGQGSPQRRLVYN